MIYLGDQKVFSYLGNAPVKIKSLVNIFDLSKRTEIIDTEAEGGGYESTYSRNFAENQLWKGLTRNNYFSPGASTYSISGNNTISVTTRQPYYGICFPCKIIPNARYFVKYDSATGPVYLGVYDKNGNIIRDITSWKLVKFNSNEEWFTICLTPSNVNEQVQYNNLKVYYTLED